MRRGFLWSLIPWILLGCATPGAGSARSRRSPGCEGIVSQLLVTPSPEGHRAFVEAISGARSSVRLAMFHLTDPEVAQALLAAAAKGSVRVQVILDRASLEHAAQRVQQGQATQGDLLLARTYARLKGDGSRVEVRLSSPAFSITHEKAMIIDGGDGQHPPLAFITAINLTNSADTTRDFGIVTHDEDVIREMIRVFDSDWENWENPKAPTPPVADPHLVWSPVNSRERLVDLIETARDPGDSIAATVENLDDPAIEKAFIGRAAAGIAVRMILPQCDKNSDPLHDYAAIDRLARHGVQVRVMPFPQSASHPYMHSKMIAVHGRAAYVGSVNFSTHSTQQSRELGVLFEDPKPIGLIEGFFEQDWKRSVSPEPRPTFCTPVLN